VSGTEWAGPYCSAQAAGGAALAWDPLPGGRPPGGAVRFVVRWRVTGFAHPRKRTFTDSVAAADWARRVAAARLLGAPRDDRGWPLSEPATSTVSDGGGTTAGRAPDPSRLLADDVTAVTPGAGEPPTGDGRHRTTGEHSGGQAADLRRRSIGGSSGIDIPAGTPTVCIPSLHMHSRMEPGAEPDPDIAGYVEKLVVAHRPYWEQTNQDRWWIDQLRFVQAALRYPPGDPRIARHGVAAGDSIHFRLLGHADLDAALNLRRTTNLRNAHQNRQRREAYERKLAEYEAKLVAWEARSGTGPRGRKPVRPAEPTVAPETSDGQVLISANTENRFKTALSFVFDRAFDAGMFPPGPNPYRQWAPRGSGGRHAGRRSPFRRPERHTAATRDYPGLGFWVDLGDALAARGRRVADGLRTSERYRILPLVAVLLAPRPGELVRLRLDHFLPDLGTVLIENEDGHLKAREVGETRTAPLSGLVAALVDQHAAAGLAGPDGTLVLSPEGRELDLGNFYDKRFRPAIADLCGEGRPWPIYPALTSATFYDTRKAGITTWIVQGADTYEASTWSGDTEEELLRSYRGVHQGRGRRAVWRDIDTAVERALLEDPPRGDGRLATHVRVWLGLD
jgi:integrase